jgi:hypothetical protein
MTSSSPTRMLEDEHLVIAKVVGPATDTSVRTIRRMDNLAKYHGKLGGTTIFMKASIDRFSKSVSMWAIIVQRRLRVLR